MLVMTASGARCFSFHNEFGIFHEFWLAIVLAYTTQFRLCEAAKENTEFFYLMLFDKVCQM